MQRFPQTGSSKGLSQVMPGWWKWLCRSHSDRAAWALLGRLPPLKMMIWPTSVADPVDLRSHVLHSGASVRGTHSCPSLLQTMPSRCGPGGQPGRPGGLRRSSLGTVSASGANTGKPGPQDACLVRLEPNAAPASQHLEPLPRLSMLRADRCCCLGSIGRPRTATNVPHTG